MSLQLNIYTASYFNVYLLALYFTNYLVLMEARRFQVL